MTPRAGRPSTTGPTTVAAALTTMTPTQGAAGTVVTFEGENLGSTAGRVLLVPVSNPQSAGAPMVIRLWTPSKIVASVPGGILPGIYSPELWTATGNPVGPASAAAWPEFTVLGPSPTVTTVRPSDAPAGVTVTIIGRDFGANPGRVVFVQFWGTLAATYTTAPIVSWTSTEVVVRSPGGQNGMARIRLTTAAGQGVWAGTVHTGGPQGGSGGPVG